MSVFTSATKIKKAKKADPTPFEESVAQALYDLQVNSDKLKGTLLPLFSAHIGFFSSLSFSFLSFSFRPRLRVVACIHWKFFIVHAIDSFLSLIVRMCTFRPAS